MNTQIIKPFDPWKSPLCTCPQKFSFDPYTGCGHRCVYCYATSYIKKFYFPRRKKDLIKKVKKDLEKIPESSLISISNSSDPYQPIEEKFKDFRECLKLFSEKNLKILILTKSDLVLRDIDLLKQIKCAVTITVTTLREEILKKWEPLAPHPEKRFKALKILAENKINTGLRFDPVCPFLNDEEIDEIIKKAKEAKVSHIVSSTLKIKQDIWKRLKNSFGKLAGKLKILYFKKGEKLHNSFYLPRALREELLTKIKITCEKYKISFAVCREGFLNLNSSLSCDGSHLIS